VAVFDGATRARVADFLAFEATFRGGVYVAAADLDGDGYAEVVVTPGAGGGPVVAVFSGAALASGQAAEVARYWGIADEAFRGGCRAAAGDVDGDGTPDVFVVAGDGGAPRVALFDGASVAAGDADPRRLAADFFALDPALRTGLYAAAGDVDGDGSADLVLGAGDGGAPRVRVAGGRQLLAAGPLAALDDAPACTLADVLTGPADLRGGVCVATRDMNTDGRAEVVAAPGGSALLRAYAPAALLAGGSEATWQANLSGDGPAFVFIG
jgi:hypothetical protein